MKLLLLPVNLVKQFILDAQGFKGCHPGKEGILSTIKKLGYVQIDTIAVIQRAHHHVLWTRCPDYQEQLLHELQAVHGQVFEYWTHAMSYLPIADYRFALPKMRKFANPTSPWVRYQLRKCRDLLEPVLRRIQDEGPLSASDFKSPPGKKTEGWWDWKPAKVALEILFWQGDLMIRERRKFQKVYDLTERVLPTEVNTTLPTEQEAAEYLIRRALTALGVAEEREILKFMQPESSRDADMQLVDREQLRQSLQALLEAGEIVQLKIDHNHETIYYALPASLAPKSANQKSLSPVYLLSPFDNLIIQRDRVRRLFGFDYALECYLPAHKRRYGYFTLPILWGTEFVGRLDPRADRKNRTLTIHHVRFEPGFKVTDEFLFPFVEKIHSFTRFNQCERLQIENISPKKMKSKINSMLRHQFEG